MGILDDTALFVAIIQQGGFAKAARHFGLSNGLISRRMSALEASLGVTLIKRTTRQLKLTPEGELFWQHAQRIQQEFDSAISLIQSSAKKPKGSIRISAPPYFGRHCLTPVIAKFLQDFPDIHIELILASEQLDLIDEKLDLVIRGAGFLSDATLPDSSMQMKWLMKSKVGVYASANYLQQYGEPKSIAELNEHQMINYSGENKLMYYLNNEKQYLDTRSRFTCNDIESALIACQAGCGIAKFAYFNVRTALQEKLLKPILEQYDWGEFHLYVIYPQQQTLPKRTRLLVDFLDAHMRTTVCTSPC